MSTDSKTLPTPKMGAWFNPKADDGLPPKQTDAKINFKRFVKEAATTPPKREPRARPKPSRITHVGFDR